MTRGRISGLSPFGALLVALLVLVPMATAWAAAFPGPDETGYVGSAIPFNLRDISATGASAGVQCDDCTNGPFPIPFTFNFYGNDYSQLRVSSNGFVTFNNDSNSYCCSGQPIPTAGSLNNYIAVFWDDMYPAGGGNVRYATLGSAPNREFVIGWYTTPYCCSGSGVLTAEIILHESTNRIELQYASAPGRAGRTSAGIENEDGSIGIQLGFGAFNFSNQGFLFTPGPPPPPPPAETIAMPTRDAKIGTPIVVWGITTIPNHTVSVPTTYTIDFGDGSPVATGNVTDRSYIAVTHQYDTSGIFPMTLTVVRDTTTQSATTQVKVFAPAAGSAAARNLGVNMAIQDGLRSLWLSQSNRTKFFSTATTNWSSGGGYPASITSLVVLSFENHGYRLPANPLDEPTGIYEKYLVRRGLNYILDALSTISLNRDEPGGDPCQGGVDPSNMTGCTGLGFTDFHSAYETAVTTLAVAGTGAPNRTVSGITGTSSGGYVVGKTYGEILQRMANTVVWGQADCCSGQGGWYYNLDNVWGNSDGSTMGWGILALLDAEAAGAVVPAFARSQLAIALQNQLNTDGSLDYQVDGNPDSNNNTNVAKTGIGLQGLFFSGTSFVPADLAARKAAALAYISSRWSVSGPGDTFFCTNNSAYNKGCGYGMFNVFKALKLHGVDTLPGVTRPAGPGAIPEGDWYADYVDYLVTTQTSPNTTGGGQWTSPALSFSCCYYDEPSVTAIAELILAPTALVLPTSITLAPPTATNDLTQGQNTHTLTATAGTEGGGVVAGATVTFTVTSGPNAGTTGTGVTNAQGIATFTYTSNGQAGRDVIVANLGNLTSNEVEKIWISNQPPVAQCQDVTVRTSTTPNNECQTSTSVNNGSFDPDQGDQITLAQVPSGPYGLGSTSVTLTVTDDDGASSQCTATVTVVDDTAPVVTCSAPAVAECTGGGGATVGTSATAQDNCSGSLVATGPGSAFYPLGTSVVSYSATDGSGNTGSCSTSVTVRDTTPPTISCPAAIQVECTSPNGAPVTPGAASASDVCTGVTVAGPSAGTYPIGTTTVTYTATDGVGLTASCPATITVVDTTPPVATCVESVNPSGKNVPGAKNEDGFYKVGGTDACTSTSAVGVKLGTYVLLQGETIKITQTPGKSGVRFVGTMGPLAIRHFQVGPGDAVITVTDGSGNTSSVTCLVPPPPK